MMKRVTAVTAVIALGVALTACGTTRDYTIRQAVVDMPRYEPSIQFYNSSWDTCVAEYLFRRVRPGEVKTIIQGADFGELPPVEAQAEDACEGNP